MMLQTREKFTGDMTDSDGTTTLTALGGLVQEGVAQELI